MVRMNVKFIGKRLYYKRSDYSSLPLQFKCRLLQGLEAVKMCQLKGKKTNGRIKEHRNVYICERSKSSRSNGFSSLLFKL